MDLPFSLVERRDGTLRYGPSVVYRIISVAILALLVAVVVSGGRAPSPVGWILLALSLLGVLYEDSWTFGAKAVIHRTGLIFAFRRTELEVSRIARLRVLPYVSGTIPGSAEEARENERALSGELDAGFPQRRLVSVRKPYLILVVETKSGTQYAVDRVPARRRRFVRAMAARVGQKIGVPVES